MARRYLAGTHVITRSRWLAEHQNEKPDAIYERRRGLPCRVYRTVKANANSSGAAVALLLFMRRRILFLVCIGENPCTRGERRPFRIAVPHRVTSICGTRYAGQLH